MFKGYKHYSFDITHNCNKNCKDCSHFVEISNYKYLTLENYSKISKIICADRISEIEIIGGEPLMHPYFENLIQRIFNDFSKSRIVLVTNGKLLPRLDYEIRKKFHRIYISYYKGFNDSEISCLIEEENIFVNNSEFIKRKINNPVRNKIAKKSASNCPNKLSRFVDTRLYPCCLAESIERVYLNKKTHIDIVRDNNWESEFTKIKIEEACKYCIIAPIVFNHRLRNYFFRIKQYVLWESCLAGNDFNGVWHFWRKLKNKRNWFNAN